MMCYLCFKMTNINIRNEIYVQWVNFYKKHNKIDYPSLKNFTEKKLSEIMSLHNN